MIEIKNKSECCGCSACKNICPKHCISMEIDNEGFLYPKVQKNLCVECGLCESVCPVMNCEQENKRNQKAFLIRSCDKNVCQESTSGGAFSVIAQWVINNDGVVFGAAFNEKFEVYHTYVEVEEDLKKFRNSKYVQSNMGDNYKIVKNILKSGRMVLFSGTPCQVEGLYHFLGKKVDNLILVDTVCHAVPSPLIWEKYKEYSQKRNEGELIGASFRDKSKYGYQYSQMKMTYSNGKVQCLGVEKDPYLRAFFSNLSDRPSCYDCVFKKQYRVSDLTIWDCFDVYRFSKNFNDNKGVTRVLTHSTLGEKIISQLDRCVIEEIDTDLAVYKVKELTESVPMNPKRGEFFEECNIMSCESFFEKWFPITVRVRIESFIRHFCEWVGIYSIVKRIVRKLIGKE